MPLPCLLPTACLGGSSGRCQPSSACCTARCHPCFPAAPVPSAGSKASALHAPITPARRAAALHALPLIREMPCSEHLHPRGLGCFWAETYALLHAGLPLQHPAPFMLCKNLQLNGVASMPVTVPALLRTIDAWLLSGKRPLPFA